jgi:hypothetical protein
MAEPTELEIALDRLKKAIKNYASDPVTEIDIAGRRIVRPTLGQLLTMKRNLEYEINRDAGKSRKIKMSFVSTS